MRIALLFEFATLYGGERSMLQTLELIGPEHFVALSPHSGRLPDALQQLAVRHVPFDVRDPCGSRRVTHDLLAELRQTLDMTGANLLHANSLSMGRLTGRLSDQLVMPCTAHLRDIIGLSAAAVKDLNRNRRLIAVSSATREFHVQQGVDADRVEVVHNGVDGQCFRPRTPTGTLHDELGIPRQFPIVLTMGQIGLRKGLDVLAAAAPGIVAEIRDVQFIVAGERISQKAESVEFERQLVASFRRPPLTGRLHLVGYRDDAAKLLNEVSVLAHPAKQEPLGRVLLEAAASGLPIVATAVGGTPEILRDGVSARLVPPGDADALAGAVVATLREEARSSQFAHKARERVLTHFDARVAATRLWETWRRVVG